MARSGFEYSLIGIDSNLKLGNAPSLSFVTILVMKNITLCIAFLFLLLLGGCAPSYKPIYMSQEEFQKSFGNTFISTCVRQCGGGNFKSLYEAKNWYGLAYAEYTAGSYDDLGFYYMGIAAENLNFKEMSQKYYEASLRNSGKSGCGTKPSGCDGFSFPADIYTKLDKFSQQQGYANYQAKLASEKAVIDADLKKRAALIAEEERKDRIQAQAAKDAEVKRQAAQPAQSNGATRTDESAILNPKNSNTNTMDFGQKAIKALSDKPAYRNAIASTITYSDYGICIPLELSVMASEAQGVKFKKENSEIFGLLWAYLQMFRSNELAKGVPESVLTNSWKPYNQESLIDQQAYFNKYSNYCVNVAARISQKAAGN